MTLQDEVRQLRTSIIKTIESCEASRTCDLCKMSIDNRITTFVQQQREAATLAERERCTKIATRYGSNPTQRSAGLNIAERIRARSN